jgi:hypothetical protein
MAYVFNPFTGNFDVVDTNTAAGSDTQVQFNDGGTLAGDTALTWNKTSDQLTVGGDINLDSGGNFSTTIQSVTPTANRTISFPDQTGTVGLVSGATGNIQYNNAGQLAGTGDFNVDLNWTDPLVTYTGLKVNVTDTGSAAGSNLLDLQSGGTSKFRFDKDGTINLENNASYSKSTITLFSGTVQTRPTGGDGYKLSYNGCSFGFLTPIFIGPSTPNNNFSQGAGLYSDSQDYTLAQRNGTNAQTYRLYNTYTDASNYERLSFNWDTNVFKIKSEAAGSGTVRGIQLGSTSSEPVALFGATPVAQPTTAVGSAAVAGGGGAAVDDATTFGGYTLAQVVQALQNLGILA